jgi:hypothetical protein
VAVTNANCVVRSESDEAASDTLILPILIKVAVETALGLVASVHLSDQRGIHHVPGRNAGRKAERPKHSSSAKSGQQAGGIA